MERRHGRGLTRARGRAVTHETVRSPEFPGALGVPGDGALLSGTRGGPTLGHVRNVWLGRCPVDARSRSAQSVLANGDGDVWAGRRGFGVSRAVVGHILDGRTGPGGSQDRGPVQSQRIGPLRSGDRWDWCTGAEIGAQGLPHAARNGRWGVLRGSTQPGSRSVGRRTGFARDDGTEDLGPSGRWSTPRRASGISCGRKPAKVRTHRPKGVERVRRRLVAPGSGSRSIDGGRVPFP